MRDLSVLSLAPLALLLLASCGGGSRDGGDGGGAWFQQDDPPPSCPAAINPIEAQAKLNAARSVARMCGDVAYPAAAPLQWNDALYNAAEAHSADMANNNYFSHTGSDGSSPSQRTVADGYGPYTGENIGAGYESMDEAIAGWLNSPGHCKNIMDARYQDYAIACVSNKNSEYGVYWTQSFGIRD